MRNKILNLLSRILLSKEARELGESLKASGVTGAYVTERGTLICPAQSIQQSKEFRELRRIASRLVQNEGRNTCQKCRLTTLK